MKNNTIQHAQRSDLGQRRKNNEDDFICQEFKNHPHLLLLGAIDGVGGYEGGEKATEITKIIVEKYFADNISKMLKNPEQHIKKAVVLANNKIFSERKETPALHRMSCVASVALLDRENQRLYFAHVGDSRGYVLRGTELIKFTTDHSLVGYLEEMGEITEEEAMNHPRRNEISKLLGDAELKEDTDYIISGVHSFYPNDIALFCSDGLTDLVNSQSIIETLTNANSLEDKKEELIQKANDLGGKDNITVALATYQGTANSEKTVIPQKDELKTQIQPNKTASEKIQVAPTVEKTTPKKKNKTWVLLFPLLLLGAGIFWFKDRIPFFKKTKAEKINVVNDSIANKEDTIIIGSQSNEDAVPEPIVYDYKGNLSDGLKLVQKNNLFGFVDENDSLIIPLKYEYAQGFENGISKVKLNEKYGLINPKDSLVLSLIYNEIGEIKQDSVYVKKDSVWMFIQLKK